MRQREPPKVPCIETVQDRISSLPGHVVDQILSHLSIRDAVRTSALSRKWRYRWSKVPNLVFDSQCVSVQPQDQTVLRNKLVSVVDHVLLLHNAPIYKFKLSHRDLLGVIDIDRWILHLSRSSVKEFILEIWKGQRYKVPSPLFSFEHLSHLELFNCLLKPPQTFKGFRSLKSLDLQHITITQQVFENLIISCPLLERLTLMNFDGFTHLNINAPNLQFFDIGGIYDDVNFENTFHLTLVSIGLYKNVTNLAHVSSSKLLRFFANLPHIRRLEIQSYFLKYLCLGNTPNRLPKPCNDLNYLSIRINFNDMDENSAALCLLRSTPNVQELEILARPEDHATTAKAVTNLWEGDQWNNLFSQLRIAKIVGINGFKPELDFIEFLLSNSPVLERMTVKPGSDDGERELLKELLRFQRASIHARIIYQDP
ncbi:F-box/RNI-like superfamily protein [Euphorbia peplus]|nr:F-box/RNI-like superfamily protein [Euphorbia peplus]